MDKLEFGYKCKDIITGMTGILNARARFITGCDRIKLIKEDGKTDWFDVPMIKIIDKGVFEEIKETKHNMYDDLDNALYDFGTLAKDKITEFEGRIIVISIGISGDINYGLSPKFHRDNKDNDAVSFDEGRLEVIDTMNKKINTNSERTGGVSPVLKYR